MPLSGACTAGNDPKATLRGRARSELAAMLGAVTADALTLEVSARVGRQLRTTTQRELRNVVSCCCVSVSSKKRSTTPSASPLCRSIAFSRVND